MIVRVFAEPGEADEDRLLLEVRDSGGSLESLPSDESGEGIGLTNLRRRLTSLYGREASLAAATDQGASVVKVTLPARDAGA